MAAEHVAVVDVPGVARITCDVRRRVAQLVVVVLQWDDPRPTFAANLAPPRLRQRIDSDVDEQLGGMEPGLGIGQVAEGEIVLELVWSKCGRHGSPLVSRRSRATLGPLVNQRSYCGVALAPWPEAGRGR
jgi:hypothetical protein